MPKFARKVERTDNNGLIRVCFEFRDCESTRLDNGNIVLTFPAVDNRRLLDAFVALCHEDGTMSERDIEEVLDTLIDVNERNLLSTYRVRTHRG